MKKTLKLVAGSLGLVSIITLLNLTKFDLIQTASSAAAAAQEDVHSTVNWLLIGVALLIGAIIVLTFDISALTTRVTGKKVLNWNKINAWLCLIFIVVAMSAAFWEFFYHGKLVLTEEATAHTARMNKMFNSTLFFTGIVFVIVQIVLFWFGFIYQGKEGRKASYVSHNNKLEIVWTIIPGVVMAYLVLMGMSTWSDITKKTDTNPAEIEVFAYQFGWKARYPGADKKFGEASFNYISGSNPLGLPVEREIDALIKDLNKKLNGETIVKANGEKEVKPGLYEQASDSLFTINYNKLLEEYEKFGITYTEDKRKALEDKIDRIESGEALDDLKASIYRKEKQIDRIAQIKAAPTAKEAVFNGSTYDDIITQEIHLVKGKEVVMLFRARDVIHSAWIPHFKVQMNVVPGMQTRFRFTPIKTTAEAREERNNADYDYYLFCNKVCGSAHYNMKIKVVVETQEEYDEWMKGQTPAFVENPTVEEENTAPSEEEMPADSTAAEEIALN